MNKKIQQSNYSRSSEEGLMNDLVQEHEYDAVTGEHKLSQDNWMLETDGVALKDILY